MADSLVRIIPGVISDEQSALSDSFQDNLLAPPVYTRPAEYKGWRVPDVLLSGHEAKIREWDRTVKVVRSVQQHLRPVNSWNKPWNPVTKVVVRIPDRFVGIL
jgi:tRNA (guanine37-N1)-methyltransferase